MSNPADPLQALEVPELERWFALGAPVGLTPDQKARAAFAAYAELEKRIRHTRKQDNAE
jgi:hypothetical protein